MSGLLAALGWSAGLATGALGYGLVEAQLFTTRRVAVTALDEGELRILHLSDLHLTPGQTRKIGWLRSLEQLEPDLVVVTGDFLAHRMAVSAVAEALNPLMDRPGLFVFGSNDYNGPVLKNPFSYFRSNRTIRAEGADLPTEDLRELLSEAGWVDLNNAESHIDVAGIRVHARGTNDAHIQLDDYTSVAGPFAAGELALGVTHSPYSRVTNAFVHDGAKLVLAGHTHGGQVCLPFYGALVTNCDLPRAQAKGLSMIGDGLSEAVLHVSAGVGTSPITPVRVACRPEATLITVTARS